MSALQEDIPDARVFDLFAGSGALGLEMLSRGAEHVTFVERSEAAVESIEKNIEDLCVKKGRFAVIRDDAVRCASAAATGAFDITVADPPYSGDFLNRLISIWEGSHFSRLLCVEHGAKTKLPSKPDWTKKYGDTAVSIFIANDE